MAKIYIDFSVESDIENVDFTEIIGADKNAIRRQFIGDISIRGQKLDYSQWSCDFPLFDTNDFSKNCCDFYEKINPKKKEIISEIIRISGKMSICFVINCEKNEELSLFFDIQFLKLCNDLHATLDTDGIYQEKYSLISRR